MSNRAGHVLIQVRELTIYSIYSYRHGLAMYHIRCFLVWPLGSQPWVLLANEVVGIPTVGITPGSYVGVLFHAKAVHGHAELVT